MNQKTINVLFGGCIIGLLIGIFGQMSNSAALRGKINELETRVIAIAKTTNEKQETRPEQPKFDDSLLQVLSTRVATVEFTANEAVKGVVSLSKRADLDDVIQKADGEILKLLGQKIDLIRRGL